jgi:hypothetical protein
MSAVLDAVGFVAGAMGIFSFFKNNLPTNAPNGAVVRVKAGLQNFGDQSLVTSQSICIKISF